MDHVLDWSYASKSISRRSIAVFPTPEGAVDACGCRQGGLLGEAYKPEFRSYGRAVVENAKTLAESLMSDGLRLISGGTDNHLMLVDVTSIGLGGKQAEKAVPKVRNNCQYEYDPVRYARPMRPSGIRIGTPALTTRGMGTSEMKTIGGWICQALRHPDESKLHSDIRDSVREMCDNFPVQAEAQVSAELFRVAVESNAKINRILIADDNAANRELLEAYLASVECEIEMAFDGQDTLDKVKSFQPDLLLLDVMMPKLSGFEVCQQIKRDPSTARIMVLMVTALNELGDIERAVKAGTDDFLSKPIQKVKLLKRVSNMLRLKDTTDELERLRQYIRDMDDQSKPQ